MTKRKHPVVDVLLTERDFPDRAKGWTLAPVPEDAVGDLLELPVDHQKRDRVAPATMKGGLPGQVWQARVKRSHGGTKQVEPLRLLQLSPMERPATCPHADVCGGCNYQTLSYEAELMLKAQQLQRLYKNAGFSLDMGLRRSPRPLAYRNKMEYTFGDQEKGGPLTLGLHRPGHFYEITPTPHCQIVPPDFNTLRGAVQAYARAAGWTYYHRAAKTGALRHLVLRASLTTRELMLNLVTTSDFTLSDEEQRAFVAMLHAQPLAFRIRSIFHTVNDGLADVVQPDTLTLWDGDPFIEEKLFDLTFEVGPFSFFQPNVPGAIELYKKAVALAGDLTGKTVYDLYSGTGTLAQIMAKGAMAKGAQRVIGVEIVEEAVEKARAAAEKNGIRNVKFVAADVLAELSRLAATGERPDVVMLDPPRQGVHASAIAHIINAAPARIVYISCNPTTQVRDLALFQAGGYRVVEGQGFDQFPRTKHVETVVLMLRT